MGILFLILGVAVIGGAALLISGRWRDGLADDASLPAESPLAAVPLGDVSVGDLDAVRLDQAVRGYRMDEVDALVERLGEEIALRDDEIRRLRGGPGESPETAVPPAAVPPAETSPEA